MCSGSRNSTRVIDACGVDVGDELLHPSASVGFTLIDHRSESAERVLIEADRAMYEAKRAKLQQPV